MIEYCFNDDMTGFVECHQDLIIEDSIHEIFEVFDDNYINDIHIEFDQNETHTINRYNIVVNHVVVFIIEEHTGVLEYDNDEDIFTICAMKYNDDIYYVETIDELRKLLEGVMTGWFS